MNCFCITAAGLLMDASFAEAGTPTKTQPALPELGPPTEMLFKAKFDNTDQKYILRLPPRANPTTQYDLLIALHGHGADRRQYATDPRNECRGTRDVAAKHGLIFVSPDYRGASWMGPAAEADLVQLIAELKQKYRIRRVFVTGASMGGTAALIFTALHPQLVDGVASFNAIASMMEYQNPYAGIYPAIQKSYGGTAQQVPAEYRKRSPLFTPQKFTMPVAIVVSGKDTIVPPATTIQLAEAIQKINRHVLFLHRPETGHVTSYEDTVAALEFIIQHAPLR
jgi:dipeptidyl aminopeptidase/acylaminoacyl peptidase